jgi:hypothetical protein
MGQPARSLPGRFRVDIIDDPRRYINELKPFGPRGGGDVGPDVIDSFELRSPVPLARDRWPGQGGKKRDGRECFSVSLPISMASAPRGVQLVGSALDAGRGQLNVAGVEDPTG